ncbi:MAG: hypothetical protein IJK32_09845 [Bacteroidales bacterium]|nr:hypothetical protein [Bacteroidales bacterium]
MQAEIFELLFNSAEIPKFTPEEIVKYERDMTTERDIRNQIAYSREEGLAEGLEKGRAEGLAEGKAEVAKALEHLGIDADIIRKATGLSIEDESLEDEPGQQD